MTDKKVVPSKDKTNVKNLPLVPESILKRRHDLDEMRRKRLAVEEMTIQKPTGKKGKTEKYVVKRPEHFISRARSRRNNDIRYHRVLKKGMQKRASNKKVMSTKKIEMDVDDDDVDEDNVDNKKEEKVITYQSNSVDAPMVFAIRVRDGKCAPKMVMRALSRLRLRKVNDGVFLKYDANIRKVLHLVEPWVTYGRPSKGVILDLIERRGFGKIDDKPVPLSDNTIIEKALGDKNIICVEDLVHEIDTVGENFMAASKFLWPFQLTYNSTYFERKTLKVRTVEGRDYGDKGEDINEIIKNML